MSGEFITLTRNDPEFSSHLLGTFSKTRRALPVETYNADTSRERVTFQIVNVDEIASPSWARVYLKSCRPELALLALGPALCAWLAHDGPMEPWTRWPSWLALLGIFFLQTSTFLFTDVQDHLRGADRLNRRRGSQVIQRGWVTASAMRRWAWFNLSLAVLFGIPAFLLSPGPLLLICGLAGLALLVLLRGWGTRWGFCDLAILLLFGPLLTIGVAQASFGQWSAKDLLLGLAFGATTLWVFQLRQFENLFRANPEGFRTGIGYWNFDTARWFCIAEGFALLCLHPLVAVAFGVPLGLLTVLPLVSAPLIVLLHKLYRAASPLSSSLVGASRWAVAAQALWALWWFAVLGEPWL